VDIGQPRPDWLARDQIVFKGMTVGLMSGKQRRRRLPARRHHLMQRMGQRWADHTEHAPSQDDGDTNHAWPRHCRTAVSNSSGSQSAHPFESPRAQGGIAASAGAALWADVMVHRDVARAHRTIWYRLRAVWPKGTNGVSVPVLRAVIRFDMATGSDEILEVLKTDSTRRHPRGGGGGPASHCRCW